MASHGLELLIDPVGSSKVMLFSKNERENGAELAFSWVSLWFCASQGVEETGSTRSVEI